MNNGSSGSCESSPTKNGTNCLRSQMKFNPGLEKYVKRNENPEDASNWAIYSFRSEKILNVMKYHLSLPDGFATKSYFGEMFIRRIQTLENDSFNTVNTEDDSQLKALKISPIRVVQVEKVENLFIISNQQQKRLRVICKDIPFGGSDCDTRHLTAENGLAEILSVMLKPKDIIFVFADIDGDYEETLFLNVKSRKVRLLIHLRDEDIKPFDTNSWEYQRLRQDLAKGGVTTDFHIMDPKEHVWRVSPVDNPFAAYKSIASELSCSGNLDDEIIETNRNGMDKSPEAFCSNVELMKPCGMTENNPTTEMSPSESSNSISVSMSQSASTDWRSSDSNSSGEIDVKLMTIQNEILQDSAEDSLVIDFSFTS